MKDIFRARKAPPHDKNALGEPYRPRWGEVYFHSHLTEMDEVERESITPMLEPDFIEFMENLNKEARRQGIKKHSRDYIHLTMEMSKERFHKKYPNGSPGNGDKGITRSFNDGDNGWCVEKTDDEGRVIWRSYNEGMTQWLDPETGEVLKEQATETYLRGDSIESNVVPMSWARRFGGMVVSRLRNLLP